MTPGFEEALGLWEAGELSRDELARRFPNEDVVGVLDAFDRMGVAAAGPTPDAGAAWEAVRVKLPARLADRRRGRGKAIRLLAAATIAVLVLGASAYAVVPGARKAMNDAAGLIAGDADHSPGATEPTEPTESTETGDGSKLEGPDGDDATTDPDEGVATGDEAQADADEHEGDDDRDAGSNSGTNDDAVEDDSGSGPDEGSVGDGSGSEEDAGEAPDGGSSGSEAEESD
jgi:hypothetical protein